MSATYTLVTRAAAHAQGLTHYYTGKPCKHGHDARRFVVTGNCMLCAKLAQRQFSKANTQAQNARRQGHFTYPLHPDDHSKALGYCQSLDMARNRVPHVPGVNAPLPPPSTFVMPEHISRAYDALAAEGSRDNEAGYPEFIP